MDGNGEGGRKRRREERRKRGRQAGMEGRDREQRRRYLGGHGVRGGIETRQDEEMGRAGKAGGGWGDTAHKESLLSRDIVVCVWLFSFDIHVGRDRVEDGKADEQYRELNIKQW